MIYSKTTISNIGIGTWQLSDPYWGKQSHSDSLKTIHAALREGFSLFDTSPDYGKGRSEQLLGQQLPKDNNITISTKSFIKPPESVEKSIYRSLKRLKRDYIDNFFIHWPSTKMDSRPVMEKLEQLRNRGIIKNIGVSNFNKYELKQIEEAGKVDIVQNGFNLLWKKDIEYLKQCKSRGIITQIYSPLAQGVLTDHFIKNLDKKVDDMRKVTVFYKNENLKTVKDSVLKIKEIGDKNNYSIYNLIINWTLNQPFIDQVIVGCRTRKQVEMLKKAINIKISPEILKEINTLSENTILKGGSNIFYHSY